MRDRLDDRLRVGLDDLAVPAIRSSRASRPSTRNRPNIPVAADGFRLLAANIDFSRDSPPRTIGVTSPAPLDGKSTVAAQLAMALVASGERVLLVEGDLRRPGIRNTAVADRWNPATRGLTDYLWGAAQVDEVICAHPRLPGLSVIWAGAQVPNPSGMLASRRLGHLLAVVAERFDRVIIDTSPISVGADASIVLARLDGSLFVINARRTSRWHIPASAARDGARRRARIVVNRDERATDRHYGYYTATAAGEELAASPRLDEAPSPLAAICCGDRRAAPAPRPALLAVLVAAAWPLSAYVAGPVVLPALLIAAGVAALIVARLEAGIAVVLVLAPFMNAAVGGGRPIRVVVWGLALLLLGEGLLLHRRRRELWGGARTSRCSSSPSWRRAPSRRCSPRIRCGHCRGFWASSRRARCTSPSS